MRSYVWRELVRNPLRTVVATAGVALGVGLFSGVLFFIDGSGATMTARAVAPVAIDMQRVMTSPLGSGLRLEERLDTAGAIAAGQPVTLTLSVINGGDEPAHDVVVEDAAPPPLRYLTGTATLNGAPLRDVAGGSPLSRGVAGLGRNIGSVAPGTAVTISYRARAERAVRAGALRLRARVSSREGLEPVSANGARTLTLEQLRARIASIPGVASADGLAFVDLPPGSLRASGVAAPGPVRVFAFDRRYSDHYPSIRIAAGSIRPAAVLLSSEVSRALGIRLGGSVELRLPAGRALSLPVSGVADLAGARPLFTSRRSRTLEDFLYVPQSIVVSPGVFARTVVPALRAANAALGGVVKSLPVEEVDVRVERGRLHAGPAAALSQTHAVARSIGRIAPGQDYLVDNISNTLIVARADAAVGKRMFFFLGLPAILLAALIAAYAGGVLAGAQRREQSTLRLRGAHRGHLQRILAYRTLAVAGAGSAVGATAGFVSVLAILGAAALRQAAPGDLALSALAAFGGGMLVTAFALFVPGRRALAREISAERRELALARPPLWRQLWLDVALLAAAALAEVVVVGTGVLDTPRGSVFEGRSVSLPSYLLLVPLLAWVGGVLLSARLLLGIAVQLPVASPPRFGGLTSGLLIRSLRRRPWELGAAIVALGLVIALGTSLRAFIATYEAAKGADAGFVVGSDLRIAPGARPRTARYASRLRVEGVSGVTPVVFGLENSVLIGRYKRATTGLAAIDPATFGAAARIADSSFAGSSPRAAMAALRADPRGVLVAAATAEDLSLETGDRVRLVLALGTPRETVASFHVTGLFTRLAGFARPPDLVVGLGAYTGATSANRVDFFLARTDDHGHAGLARAVAALRAGPGARDPLAIETTETALARDQSSLTALDVRSLVDLGSLFTLLMSAAVIGIFMFGLILQRRRELVLLRAQGMHAGELRSLVLGEAALVAVGGLASGLTAGVGSAFLLVQVLRPLFILSPSVAVPVRPLAVLLVATVAAVLASAFAVMATLRRVSPTEILREP
ncbi:MAG: putative transport system permease protein [Gaiellales bacterium]|nr:putative transport system permease protein [Gaiellales bacterium]